MAAGTTLTLARTPTGYQFASTSYNNAYLLGDGSTTSALRYDHAVVARPVAVGTTAPPARRLYSNPTTGPAQLTGSAAGASVRVRATVGRLVRSTTADAAGSARLSLPAGFYPVQSGSGVLRLGRAVGTRCLAHRCTAPGRARPAGEATLARRHYPLGYRYAGR